MPRALFEFLIFGLVISVDTASAQFVREPDKRPAGLHQYYNEWLGIEPKDRLDAEIDLTGKNLEYVKTLLRKMFDADQQYRDSLHNGIQTAERKKYYWIKIIESDWVNQMILDKIITMHGWPTIDKFGEQEAEIAWYIIWHADRPFAEKHLSVMQKAFSQGRIRPGQYLSVKEKWH